MDNQPVVAAQPSRTKRMLIATLLVLGVITAIGIVVAVVASSSSYSADVSKLSAQQLEAVRIADIGIDHDAASLTTRNYATTVQASVSSANQRVRGLPGGVPSTETQALYKDLTVETTLDDAAALNNFNPKFLETIEDQLTAILNQAKVVLAKIDSEKEESTIQDVVDQTQLLLDEIPG